MQRYLLSALAASLAAADSAAAQTVTLEPLAEARLRFEGGRAGRPAPPLRRGDAARARRRRGEL